MPFGGVDVGPPVDETPTVAVPTEQRGEMGDENDFAVWGRDGLFTIGEGEVLIDGADAGEVDYNCLPSGNGDADAAGTTEGTFNGTDAGQVANVNDVSKSGCACQMAPAKLLSSPILWVIAVGLGGLRRRRVR